MIVKALKILASRQQLVFILKRDIILKLFKLLFQISNFKFLPLRTRVLLCAIKNCSTQLSDDCNIHACAILLRGACTANHSNADCGQYSAASHTRCKISCEKHGNPDGPPVDSVNNVNNLKNGPHN